MLSIRFTRIGKKKQPVFRLIVTEKTRDPWGKFLENLGSFNPRNDQVALKTERIQYWLSKGAAATASVHNLLVNQGVIKEDKVRAGKSQPGKKRQAELDKVKSDTEAKVKAEVDAKAKAEEEAKATAEAPVVAEAPAEAPAEVVAEAPAETPTETPAAEAAPEPAAAEAPAEAPAPTDEPAA